MKTVLKIVGIAVAVLLVLAIALPLLINVNNFRPQIESRLSAALGRQVKVGNLSLSILSGSVGADDLSISDDPKFSNAPFIKAKSLKVGVELIPLIFSKQLDVTKIVISHPEIDLLRNQVGVWNFSSLGGQATPNAASAEKSSSDSNNLTVGEVELSDGTISFGSVPSKRQPILYDKVNVTVKNLSMTTAFPTTITAGLPGGGSLKIDGSLGPINSNDVSLSPLQAKLTIKKLDLSQSALVDPALGIAGSADFDGSLTSDGRSAKTNGKVKASNLKLVPKGSPAGRTIEVTYTLEHNLTAQSGKLIQCDIAIGKALARLTGTYDMHGETTSVRTKLVGQAMPVDELEAVLPAVGVIMPSGSQLKGGTLSIDLDSAGPLDKLISTGSIKMSNSDLAGFNLGSKMSAVSALSGKQMGNDMKIENLSSDVRMTPEGTQLSKVSLIVPTLGTVNGAGTISPSNALNFKMNVNLSGGVAGGLTTIAGMGNSNGVPVLVGGTMSNPTFMPDVKGMVGGQLKGLMGNTTGQNNPLSGVTGLFGKKKKPPR